MSIVVNIVIRSILSFAFAFWSGKYLAAYKDVFRYMYMISIKNIKVYMLAKQFNVRI